jgi:hypothetical protein
MCNFYYFPSLILLVSNYEETVAFVAHLNG